MAKPAKIDQQQPALFATTPAEVIPPKKVAEKPAGKPGKQSRAVAVAEPVASLPAPTNMLAIIASAAADTRVDVQKMKELLAMQRELQQAEEASAFNRALHAAQAEIPRIVKDKKTDKAPYASLENVSRAIDPILRKHGFSLSFGTADSPLKDHYRIVCDLSNGGHTRRYHCDLQADTAGAKGTSNKTPIQGVGSTMSYARRYLKMMIFDLTIVGEDNDGTKRRDDPEKVVALITASQRETLVKAIEDCGVGLEKFCEHYEIKKVSDLPATRYNDACTACKNYAERGTKNHGKGGSEGKGATGA